MEIRGVPAKIHRGRKTTLEWNFVARLEQFMYDSMNHWKTILKWRICGACLKQFLWRKTILKRKMWCAWNNSCMIHWKSILKWNMRCLPGTIHRFEKLFQISLNGIFLFAWYNSCMKSDTQVEYLRCAWKNSCMKNDPRNENMWCARNNSCYADCLLLCKKFWAMCFTGILEES